MNNTCLFVQLMAMLHTNRFFTEYCLATAENPAPFHFLKIKNKGFIPCCNVSTQKRHKKCTHKHTQIYTYKNTHIHTHTQTKKNIYTHLRPHLHINKHIHTHTPTLHTKKIILFTLELYFKSLFKLIKN